MLFERGRARRLEELRNGVAAVDDAEIAGDDGSDILRGGAAGDDLGGHVGEQDSHWFSLPTIGENGEIVVTARKRIPDNQKYVVVGGKYYPNPHYDPPFDITLGQAIAIPAVVAAGAALLPEAAVAIGALRAARMARKLAATGDEIAEYLDQGFNLAQARRLAKPYTGQGHHFIPRRRRMNPKISKIFNPNNRRLPSFFIESRFNVLKPKNITTGKMYGLHYRVDPAFNFTKIKGGGVWDGKALGLKQYGVAGRLWYGSPRPLKAAVGGGAVGTGGLGYLYSRDRK
jgi:hypothetical protein